MDYKVRITHFGKRKGRFRWLVVCPLCRFRLKMHKNKWEAAIRMADDHIRGKQHNRKLYQMLLS